MTQMNDELSESELRLQADIVSWQKHKITKLVLQYLQQLSLDLYGSFQQGAFLNKEIEHAKAVGAIELGARLSHLDSESMVRELWQSIQNDKNSI